MHDHICTSSVQLLKFLTWNIVSIKQDDKLTLQLRTHDLDRDWVGLLFRTVLFSQCVYFGKHFYVCNCQWAIMIIAGIIICYCHCKRDFLCNQVKRNICIYISNRPKRVGKYNRPVGYVHKNPILVIAKSEAQTRNPHIMKMANCWQGLLINDWK